MQVAKRMARREGNVVRKTLEGQTIAIVNEVAMPSRNEINSAKAFPRECEAERRNAGMHEANLVNRSEACQGRLSK